MGSILFEENNNEHVSLVSDLKVIFYPNATFYLYNRAENIKKKYFHVIISIYLTVKENQSKIKVYYYF